jgi:hypothetical protein
MKYWGEQNGYHNVSTDNLSPDDKKNCAIARSNGQNRAEWSPFLPLFSRRLFGIETAMSDNIIAQM